MAADLPNPPGSPFNNPPGPPPLPSSDNPAPSLAPKRHRRPSVRLGDIGDQPATLRTSTSTTSSWRLNPHSFKSSKTRPLTNLVTNNSTSLNTNNGFFTDYSPDSPTTIPHNNNGHSNPNPSRKFPKRTNPTTSKRLRPSNLTLHHDDDTSNGPHDADDHHHHNHDEGFRDFDPEDDQQSPLHSADDVALLDAWHGHNRRSIRLPSTTTTRISDSHPDLGLDASDSRNRASALDDGVRNWLVGLGLARYAPVFEIHEVDDDVLPYLTLEDLKDMGINAVGSRRKLYSAIQKLRKGLSPISVS